MTMTLGLSANACAQTPLPPIESRPAPAFTHTSETEWINSKPLNWEQLRGQVVLLDFWTFDCWNCYHSIPWLQSVESQFQDHGLRIIGIHTPELPQERVKANVVQKVEEYNIHHPVVLDNDYSYWNAFGNQYWPAFYLIDKKGRVRQRFVGETHIGDRNALAVESAIQALLAEPS